MHANAAEGCDLVFEMTAILGTFVCDTGAGMGEHLRELGCRSFCLLCTLTCEDRNGGGARNNK